MSLAFESETLNIGGFEIMGTVLVETRVTDGSFDHAFGREHVEDLEFLPGGFVPDSPCQALDDALTHRAVQNWIDSHEKQEMRAYERKVKS